MPNKYWRNMHGADYKGGGGKDLPKGSAPSAGASPEKTANWPGLPGPTQPKDRSAGQPRKGWKGNFEVKKVGL